MIPRFLHKQRSKGDLLISVLLARFSRHCLRYGEAKARQGRSVDSAIPRHFNE